MSAMSYFSVLDK